MASFWFETFWCLVAILADPYARELNYLRKQNTVFDYIENRPTEIDNLRRISSGSFQYCETMESSFQVLRSVDLYDHY